MTREELKTLVEGSPLETGMKNEWIKRIESEELTKEFYDELIDAVQANIDQEFAKAGVSDENDPEVKEKYQGMLDQIKVANDKYNATMEDLSKQTAQVQAGADKDFSQLTADIVKGNLP